MKNYIVGLIIFMAFIGNIFAKLPFEENTEAAVELGEEVGPPYIFENSPNWTLDIDTGEVIRKSNEDEMYKELAYIQKIDSLERLESDQMAIQENLEIIKKNHEDGLNGYGALGGPDDHSDWSLLNVKNYLIEAKKAELMKNIKPAKK